MVLDANALESRIPIAVLNVFLRRKKKTVVLFNSSIVVKKKKKKSLFYTRKSVQFERTGTDTAGVREEL